MEPTSRILFVDDEPRVLDGLRDRLRRHRKTWDMEFAIGGEEGIRALERAPVDVLVTDAKMPGVDGVAVLKYARAHRPDAVRIVLSGEAGDDLALRLGPHAHQSLAKPCRNGELESTIGRACALRKTVGDPELRALLGNIGDLPGLPRTYASLVTVLEQENAGAAEVARVVETDLALCAKVLQLVNSAFFGVGRPVHSILQAVTLLGVDLVKGLALTNMTFPGEGMAKEFLGAFERIQEHSMAVAEVALTIADPAERGVVFTTALLHDLGLLVEFRHNPELLKRIESAAGVDEVRGGIHPALGAYLLGLWGLPLDLVECVAGHHAPLAPDASSVARTLRRAEIALETAMGHLSVPLTSEMRERAIELVPTIVLEE